MFLHLGAVARGWRDVMNDIDKTRISMGGVVLLLAIGLIYAVNSMLNLHDGGKSEIVLPVLAITGIVMLLAALSLVSLAFGFFGLSDKSQALALPEGSIRAVLALSLVVLFSILTVFLYQNLASAGPQRKVENLTSAQREDFLKQNKDANLRDVVVIPVSVKDKEGNDTTAYTISYRDPKNQPADDFAKQLLIMIGNLMTAMVGFYFGARTAVSASQIPDQGSPPPTVRSIDPNEYSLISGNTFDLQVKGDNLNTIKSVMIVQAGNQIHATDIVSNDHLVKCKITVQATDPKGLWDVIVTDGASKSAKLVGALTIKA